MLNDECIPLRVSAIDRERVIRARARPIEAKLRAGGELFDDMIVRMRDGVRFQFPRFTDEEIKRELRRRLRISRQLEARGSAS